MPDHDARLDQRSINTIRFLAIDAVERAHSGTPMGAASIVYTLWERHLKFNPDWLNRDRFILSAGHASMLLYALMYLTGYSLTLEDIKQFRQRGSITPGHPEAQRTKGVAIGLDRFGASAPGEIGLKRFGFTTAHIIEVAREVLRRNG